MIENSTYAKTASQNKQMHYSPNLLNTIVNAVENFKVAVIEYDSSAKGVSVREIEPMAIVYKDRKRHLVGWCRLRGDYRSFRLDRLNSIKLKQEEFSRRNDFNVSDFEDGSNTGYDESYDEQD
ncbi:MAG TPA: WYL domain-containing protein [Chitinophagales bacterium]|nr:WYL domain-containing protein [Chitinophagales bacterium]